MPRNAVLDHARLWAAFGIVWFHAKAPGAGIGYAALPFFAMLLICLALPGAARQAPGAFTRGRARRLLVPWLVWSAVYAALKLVEVALTDKPLASEFAPWMLLTGPAIHLWFLPFAFLASLALYPLARLPRPVARQGFDPVLPVLVGATLAALALWQGAALPVPFQQWAFVAPATILALAFARAGSEARAVLSVLALAGLIAVVALSLGWTKGLLQLGLAATALALCLLWVRPATALSDLAAECALTVYLVHPAIAAVLLRTGLVETGTISLAVLVCGLSLAVALVPRWIASRRALAV